MGRLGIAGMALLLAGCGEANVYPMKRTDAYRLLSTVKIEPSGTGVFGRLDASVSGRRPSKVTWRASGSHARRECVISLNEVEPERTRVDVTCNGGGAGDGAAGGLATNMTRKSVIEMIDATLTGRAYDPARANGRTASRWPDDVVDHGNYGTAVRDARRMDAEARAMAADTRR